MKTVILDIFEYGVFIYFIGLAVIILIWMALREVYCWFYKTNEILANQKIIIEMLEQQKATYIPATLEVLEDQRSVNDPEVLQQTIDKLNNK